MASTVRPTTSILSLKKEDEEALAAAEVETEEDAVPYNEEYRKDSWLWSKGTCNMSPDQMKEWEAEAWISLAETPESSGHAAYAKHHAAMYGDLADDAEFRFKKVGHPDFVLLSEHVLLHERVASWRKEQLEWMVLLVKLYSWLCKYFVDKLAVAWYLSGISGRYHHAPGNAKQEALEGCLKGNLNLLLS
ncbi:hypothetical protein K435DRAFT_813375 [Dendrothele bispora CBS 962.96]|uniref:Uncharacterized protein n=1 Tax=Dendrothele bispora (strain CBS 962.96) TaxID=1314807 RepID=A0A4S8KLS9_DENBC|nr:hypothetical protein K435DRAFT_813375 [Dendrothele bispora CBS 962.96]